MSDLNKIKDLELFSDVLGNVVSTPVLQIGSGAPHVVMVALQHGWEVIGLDTALQVMKNSSVIGTLTFISVANPDAFSKSNRIAAHDMSPSTKQPTNMNRVHPGKSDGNFTERSALAIDKYIQELKPDYVIDLHSYASQSVPHCIIDPCEADLASKIEQWMKKSQNNWYKEFSEETLSSQSLDNALAAIWVNRGVMSVTIELGPLRSFSPDQASAAQQALSNLLIACDAIDGEIIPQIHSLLKDHVWQRTEINYKEDNSGYLRVLSPVNTLVSKGETIAEIVTPTGKTSVVNATSDGVVFIWSDEYRVYPGSTLGIMLVRA